MMMFLYNLCVIIDGGSAVLMYIFNQVVHDDDSDDDEYDRSIALYDSEGSSLPDRHDIIITNSYLYRKSSSHQQLHRPLTQ